MQKRSISLWLILFANFSLSMFNPTVHAATRLGLHVTQEELYCWRQRAGIESQGSNGVTCPIKYVSTSDVSTNSPGDWDHIVANKESFRADTTIGCWSGPTNCADSPTWDTGSCISNAEMDGSGFPGLFNAGYADEVRDAAFFAMVNSGHATASDAAGKVRTFLLNHANTAKLNFANKSLFCEGDVTGDGNPRFELTSWLTKLLYAYEYLQIYGNITGGDATALDPWFLNAGYYFRAMTFGASPFTSSNYENIYPNHESEYATTVALGDKYTSALGSGFNSCPQPGTQLSLYDGGPLISDSFEVCSNRGMHLNNLMMQVGVKYSDTELIRHSKEWIQSCMIYYIWGNGDDNEMKRVYDNGLDDEDHGHQYLGFKLGSIVDGLDALARSGDFSMYTYSTSDGVCQINATNDGGPKTIELWLDTYAKYIDHTLARYAPGASHIALNQIDTRYHAGAGEECGRHWEAWSLPRANHYYAKSYWKNMYLRQNGGGPIAPPAYPSTAATCGGQGYLWGGSWSTLPGSLFMFGDTEHLNIFEGVSEAPSVLLRLIR